MYLKIRTCRFHILTVDLGLTSERWYGTGLPAMETVNYGDVYCCVIVCNCRNRMANIISYLFSTDVVTLQGNKLVNIFNSSVDFCKYLLTNVMLTHLCFKQYGIGISDGTFLRDVILKPICFHLKKCERVDRDGDSLLNCIIINSSRPSGIFMRQLIKSPLVKIMFSRLFSANPSEPMSTYYQFDTREHISMKFYLTLESFRSGKCVQMSSENVILSLT